MDNAYKCYCSPEEIEEQKKELDKKKYLIFIIENGEMQMKKMLLKKLNL